MTEANPQTISTYMLQSTTVEELYVKVHEIIKEELVEPEIPDA